MFSVLNKFTMLAGKPSPMLNPIMRTSAVQGKYHTLCNKL